MIIQSAIFIATNPVAHFRTKHIELYQHFIRNLVNDNTINLFYCPTDLQIADILTKPLTKVKFVKLRELLRINEVFIKGGLPC